MVSGRDLPTHAPKYVLIKMHRNAKTTIILGPGAKLFRFTNDHEKADIDAIVEQYKAAGWRDPEYEIFDDDARASKSVTIRSMPNDNRSQQTRPEAGGTATRLPSSEAERQKYRP